MKTKNAKNQKTISSGNLPISKQQSKNLSLETWNALTQHICVKALEEEDTEILIRVLQLDRDKARDKAIEDRHSEESRASYEIVKQIIMLTGVTVLIAFGSNIALTYLEKNNDFLNTTSQTVTTSVIGLATSTIGFVLGKNSNKQNK